MVAGAMPHFSPVLCTLLNVSAWIFFGSFCLTNNLLYFTQKERILFAFMPHWTGSSSIQRPNVSQYHNMHVFYALLNAFWLLKFFSRPERCSSFRMSWGELRISQKSFRLIQNCYLPERKFEGLVWDLKSPKVAQSRLKSPKIALSRLKSPLVSLSH